MIFNKELILNNDFEQYKNTLLYKEWELINGVLKLKKDNRFTGNYCYKDSKNNVFSVYIINRLIKKNFPLVILKKAVDI